MRFSKELRDHLDYHFYMSEWDFLFVPIGMIIQMISEFFEKTHFLTTPIRQIAQEPRQEFPKGNTDLKFKKFPPQNPEKKLNHIFRNCKNADIGIQMYGIPDLTTPRLSFYDFGKFFFGPQ